MNMNMNMHGDGDTSTGNTHAWLSLLSQHEAEVSYVLLHIKHQITRGHYAYKAQHNKDTLYILLTSSDFFKYVLTF